MSVASIFNARNQLAQTLVAARGASAPFANALASAGNALTGNSTVEANSLVNQQNYDQALTKTESQLTQWFQAAGVDSTSDIQLMLRSDGTVQLANDPIDADKIQQVLDEHPEIGSMLQSLQTSYQQANPDSSATTGTATPQFTLTLSGGQATASLD